MRIVDIQEKTASIASEIRNACIDFSKMTVGEDRGSWTYFNPFSYKLAVDCQEEVEIVQNALE